MRRILVVGPSWVGDMVMAQCLFKAIKQQDPNAQIDVLAPEWSAALTARMPEVSETIYTAFGHGELKLAMRFVLGRKLKKMGYQEAYILPNSFKSALVPWFANIPRRIGWRGEMRFGLLTDIRFLDKSRYALMIERFIALAYPVNTDLSNGLSGPMFYPRLIVQQQNINQVLDSFKLNNILQRVDKPRILALCPGAEFGPSKRWPSHYFSAVAKYFLAEGWRVWLFGSANDSAIAKEIQEFTNHQCDDFIGKTKLDQAIDLLSIVDCVISNDSGLMHIAAALDLPMVAIYGSTSLQFTPPLTQKVKIVKRDLPCSPCFKRDCPLGHHACMTGIAPDRVIEAVQGMLI